VGRQLPEAKGRIAVRYAQIIYSCHLRAPTKIAKAPQLRLHFA